MAVRVFLSNTFQRSLNTFKSICIQNICAIEYLMISVDKINHQSLNVHPSLITKLLCLTY